MLSWLREFSKTLAISIRRLDRDRRARVFLLLCGLIVIYPLLLLGAFVYAILHSNGRTATAVVYLFFLASGGAIFILLKRSHKRENDLLNFSLTGQTGPELRVSAAVEQYLSERIVILASLVARAASEGQLRAHPLPPGAVPVVRQRQNALLRERGLWEKLEPEEEALAAAGDGQWTIEQMNRAETWCEQIRLLRWVLGLDSILMPLEHFPRSDFALTNGLLEPRAISLRVSEESKPGQLLIERNIAMGYVARTYAELKAGGRAGEPALNLHAGRVHAMVDGASTDLLAGAKTVGELDDQSLGVLGIVSSSRAQYAEYLGELLGAESPFPFSSRAERPG